jgi:Glycine-rich domain-containing protein-like
MNKNLVFSVNLLLAITNSQDPELVNLNESQTLQSIADYQKFLELAKVAKHSVVPTKRIDAVWHLHMLHPVAYHKDCMDFFGYILDHRPSDGTESNKKTLEVNFQKTSQLWKKTFGVNYASNSAICDGGGSGGDCSGGDCCGTSDGVKKLANSLAAECHGDAPGCSTGGSCSTASCSDSD